MLPEDFPFHQLNTELYIHDEQMNVQNLNTTHTHLENELFVGFNITLI